MLLKNLILLIALMAFALSVKAQDRHLGDTVYIGKKNSTNSKYIKFENGSGSQFSFGYDNSIPGLSVSGNSGVSSPLFNAINQGSFRFYEGTGGGSNYVQVNAPSTLAANYVLTLPVDDGTPSQVLATDGSGVLSWMTVNTSVPLYATIEDQKPSGTGGGTFTSGAQRIRDLNTISGDNGVATLVGSGSGSGSEFQLGTGEYFLSASAPAWGVNEHQALLFNVTSSTVVATGTSEYSNLTSQSTISSKISARITVSGNTKFRITHGCGATKASDGFGRQSGIGAHETYTQVNIIKIQ